MGNQKERIVVSNQVDEAENKLQVRAGKDRSGEFLGIMPPESIRVQDYLVAQAAVREFREELRRAGFDTSTLKIDCDYGKED
jgi:hypothetical protein